MAISCINIPVQTINQITTYGAFIYADYLFDKIYSFGAKYDYTNGIIGDTPGFNTLSNDDKNNTQGITGWFGYYPIEHTLAFRLNVQQLMYQLCSRNLKRSINNHNSADDLFSGSAQSASFLILNFLTMRLKMKKLLILLLLMLRSSGICRCKSRCYNNYNL